MWHWLIAHLHIVWAYGYEVLGGILIFYSSAVTETSMPEDRKRIAHWIMFAAIAVVYAGFGSGLRYDEVQQGESAKKQAGQDRQDLRDMRTTMDRRMDGVFSSFQSTYLQLASLSSDIHNMRSGLTETIYKNDPRRVADLEQQAKVAQQQVDSLSHELLSLTMAPQIARQLRDWEGDRRSKQQELHDRGWDEHIQWNLRHPGESESQSLRNWDVVYKRADDDALEQLKRIVAAADFIRREMLQRIPPQRQSSEDKNQEQNFENAKSDPESLSRDDTARYLEALARRVPPPTK